ncbi:type III toxin-antitoxin system ToxN/AbiQ family toxin [Oribacterium sp. WCC10]|uniref:type III toxin-antitoxin system ToxN/AbiQ family toxin n=1 Tax=Oribacterium sp. WCC10 TaxID=1855343 RepID=UPI00158705A7|nr:type III toxin-antitoxin system ToxN/AbiQ family toxin [Oribacterium sp. WCC10]
MLKLYSVSDEYIHYLRVENHVTHVFDSKEGHRTHKRKYIGIVISINTYNYFAPLSSPKASDYIDGKIRSSNTSILRITKIDKGQEILLSTIKLLNMIPVPDSELLSYNPDEETDLKYKSIIKDEIRWIERNDVNILNNSRIIYNLKIHESERKTPKNIKLLNAILPFKELEKLHDNWIRTGK